MKAAICTRELNCEDGHKLTTIRSHLIRDGCIMIRDGCYAIKFYRLLTIIMGADYFYGCRTCFNEQQTHKYE